MNGKYKYEVGKEGSGERVDLWVASQTEAEGLTRSAVRKLIDSGKVFVNGKKEKAGYKLRGGDIVEVDVPPPEAVDIAAEDISFDVLYEDEGMAVINKPRNMVTHPAPGHFSGTLVNALMGRFDGELSGINGELRPGIVHRLDRDTSGVIAIAKNDFYHRSLSEQLKTREMSRVYKALVYGNVKGDGGVIDTYIGRHRLDRKKMAVVPESSGRRAVTEYTVIERLGGGNNAVRRPRVTLIEAKLRTGRTHQIRVHMAHIGYPLVGDTVYGSEKQPLGNLGGQILHAERIGFKHPLTGEYTEVCASMPEYFLNVLRLYES